MRLRLLVLYGLLVLVPVSVSGGSAQDEAAVKADFVYRFTKFVEWPTNDGGDLRICLIGEENAPLLHAVRKLEGNRTYDRSIRVRGLAHGLEGIARCHVVLITMDAAGRLDSILGAARGAPTLTIGDGEGFVAAGGMIGLTSDVIDDKLQVRFDINARAAQKAGLKLSAQLLKVARRVIR